MSADSWVGTIVTVAVLAYLFYTLLRPEKF